jgi:hypothetical protein
LTMPAMCPPLERMKRTGPDSRLVALYAELDEKADHLRRADV